MGTLTPNANAALDVEANDKGILIPRVDAAQRAAMAGANSNRTRITRF